jgi:transcriptional regulator with PAS, ATPase and Fis domain
MSNVPPTQTPSTKDGRGELLATESGSLREAAFEARKQAEAQIILAALDKHHWNRRRAAQALNISYRSLMYKMKYCGLRNGAPLPVSGNREDHE